MSVKSNLKTVATKPVTMTLSGSATVLELTADGMTAVESGMKGAPSFVKGVLKLPFTARAGYLMEADGLSEADAKKKSYKWLEQDIATTMEEIGIGTGKLFADVLKEEPTN